MFIHYFDMMNILVFRPFQLQQKEKTNSGYKHFEILASGQCDLQCKIKETLLIRDLKPALNENVGSENLTPDVVSFFHCCLASYQYLALVFVFLNLVRFCNRHFWRCML